MVKFVAKGKIKAGSFDQLDAILNGDISNTGPGGFNAESGKYEVKVGGTGFTYLAGFPLTGTIEQVKVYFKNELLYKINGMSLTMTQAQTFKSIDDALKDIFKGDDVLKGSKENDYLRGFDGDDTIKGRAGKDKLQGDKGEDTLNGGKHKDTYLFKDGPGNGMDTITNLQSGEKMKFDHDMYAGIGSKGHLDASLYVEDGNFTNGLQRFSYDTSTKILSYDSDGNGAGAAQAVAYIAKGDFDEGHLFVT